MSEQLLVVNNLRTEIRTRQGRFNAVDGISFELNRGETVAVVGESGCGKSMTALSIMGLLPQPLGRVLAGEILFQGRDLCQLSKREMQTLRGRDLAMIFQEPMTSLNPVLSIGEQLQEGLMLHRRMGKNEAREYSTELLRQVGIPSAADRLTSYPHQLSGGMRQRVMIAMAMSCQPSLLIADEPTTALDVTIQAQILRLLKDLQEQRATSILLITHDLGVVAGMADRVLVMYLGRLVEAASVHTLFSRPLHPYTDGLLRSIPSMRQKRQRLHQIDGAVPKPTDAPGGCPFHPRCPQASAICAKQAPELRSGGEGVQIACWHPLHSPLEEVGS
ncbi:MAG: ABC transporter ATP-binding protein [Bacillota bacterium]